MQLPDPFTTLYFLFFYTEPTDTIPKSLPLAILAIYALIAVYCILRTRREKNVQRPDSSRAISGWLLFFILSTAFALMLAVIERYVAIKGHISLAFTADNFLFLLFAVTWAYTLCFLSLKRAETLYTVKILLLSNLFFGSGILALLTPFAGLVLAFWGSKILHIAIIQCIYNLSWFIYFSSSRRIR